MRPPSRTFPASSKSCAKAIFSASSRRANGRRSRRLEALQANWSKWEGLPDQAKLFDYVRATKIATDDVTGHVGDADAALGAGGRQARHRDL